MDIPHIGAVESQPTPQSPPLSPRAHLTKAGVFSPRAKEETYAASKGRDEQEKVFTRWCNTHLKVRKIEIPQGGLTTGALDDGSVLWNLLSQISGKNLPRLDPPKSRTHKIINLGVSLRFLEENHIKLVAIGAEDIIDHINKLILGMIWTIILRFQICGYLGNEGDKQEGAPAPPQNIVEAKKGLLAWLESMGITGKLADCFSDGKKLVHLINLIEPGTIKDSELTGNVYKDTQLAMERAEQCLDIPKVCDVEDLIGPGRDEKIVMTYVSFFRDKVKNPEKLAALAKAASEAPTSTEKSKPIEKPVQAQQPADDTTDAAKKAASLIASSPDISSPQMEGCRDISDFDEAPLAFVASKQTKFQLRTLGVKKKEDVKVNITNEDGKEIEAEVTIIPAGNDLWDVVITPKNSVSMLVKIDAVDPETQLTKGTSTRPAPVLRALTKKTTMGNPTSEPAAQRKIKIPISPAGASLDKHTIEAKTADGTIIPTTAEDDHVTFTCPKECDVTLSILTPAGSHISGSPKTFHVTPEPVFKRISDEKACIQNKETILGFSANSLSKDDVEVVVLENGKPLAHDVTFESKDDGKQELSVTFTPLAENGEITVEIKPRNEKLEKPQTTTLNIRPAPAISDISTQARALFPSKFKFKSNWPAEELDVRITDQNGKKLDIDIEQKENDFVKVTFVPQDDQKLIGTILVEGTQAKAPTTINVAPAYYVNFKNFPDTAMATLPITFTVDTNAEKDLVFKIVNQKTNKRTQPSVSRTGESTTEVTFVPPVDGEFAIHAMLPKIGYRLGDKNSIQVTSAPAVEFESRTLSPRAGKPVTMIMKSNVPSKHFHSTVTSDEGAEIPSTQEIIDDQTVAVTFIPPKEGDFTITTFANKAPAGCTHIVYVRPAPFVKVVPLAAGSLIEGRPAKLDIQTNITEDSDFDQLVLTVTDSKKKTAPFNFNKKTKSIEFTAPEAESVTIEGTIDGQPIAPYTVKIAPKPVELKPFFSLNAVHELHEDEKSTISLVVANSQGKKVEFDLKNSNGKPILHATEWQKDTVTLSFVPTNTSSISLVPLLGGTAMAFADGTTVLNLNVSPKPFVKFDALPKKAIVKKSATVKIVSNDYSAASFKITDPNGKNVKYTFNDGVLKFTPLLEGKFTLQPLLNGEESGSPRSLNVFSGTTNKQLSLQSYPKTGIIGVPYEAVVEISASLSVENITMIAIDKDGNKIQGKHKPAPAKKKRRNTEAADDNDKKVKKETFVFTPTTIGKHEVSLKCGNSSFPGCPYSINVATPQCTLLGINSKGLSVGLDFEVQVQVIGDPSEVTVSFVPFSGETETVKPKKTGTENIYSASFLPLFEGVSLIEARYNGKHIENSPISLNVEPDPWSSTIITIGPSAQVGEAFFFELVAPGFVGLEKFAVEVMESDTGKLIPCYVELSKDQQVEGAVQTSTGVVIPKSVRALPSKSIGDGMRLSMPPTASLVIPKEYQDPSSPRSKPQREDLTPATPRNTNSKSIKISEKTKVENTSPSPRSTVSPRSPRSDDDELNKSKSKRLAVKKDLTDKPQWGTALTSQSPTVPHLRLMKSEVFDVPTTWSCWFTPEREGSVLVKVLIGGRPHATQPIYRVNVKPESNLFKNSKPWSSLPSADINEGAGITIGVFWQSNKKSSVTLAFACCLLSDLGTTTESLFEGHRVSVTGAVELTKIDTHQKSARTMFLRPMSLRKDTVVVPLFAYALDKDLSQVGKIVFAKADGRQTLENTETWEFPPMDPGTPQNTFFIGVICKNEKKWRFEPVGKYTHGRFMSNYLPRFTQVLKPYCEYVPYQPPFSLFKTQVLDIHPDVTELHIRRSSWVKNAQIVVLTYSWRNNLHGIIFPDELNTGATNYLDRQILFLKQIPPWIKVVLILSLPKPKVDNIFEGFSGGKVEIQAVGNDDSYSNLASMKKQPPYDLATVRVEADNFNLTADKSVIECKIFRRSYEAPWQYTPVLSGSIESTLDGLTAKPDEAQSTSKFKQVSRSKSSQSFSGQLFSPRRETILDEDVQDPTLMPFLAHTWKPTPQHIFLVIVSAKTTAHLPASCTHIHFSFSPLDSAYTFTEHETKHVAKGTPHWGQTFEFRGIKNHHQKEIYIQIKLWVSTVTGDPTTSNTGAGTCIAIAKVPLREPFLDSALAGCTNIEKIVPFKSKEKKKHSLLDLHIRYIAY